MKRLLDAKKGKILYWRVLKKELARYGLTLKKLAQIWAYYNGRYPYWDTALSFKEWVEQVLHLLQEMKKIKEEGEGVIDNYHDITYADGGCAPIDEYPFWEAFCLAERAIWGEKLPRWQYEDYVRNGWVPDPPYWEIKRWPATGYVEYHYIAR